MPETVKLNLRLPPDLHQAATETAAVLGVSLNAYILHAIANWTNYQTRRIRQGKPVAYADPIPAAASREVPKVGANQPCPCGSGKKYKKCHGGPAMA